MSQMRVRKRGKLEIRKYGYSDMRRVSDDELYDGYQDAELRSPRSY
jgi:hypothetical protein